MVLDPILRSFVHASVAANEGRPAIPDATVEEARAGYEALAGLGPGPEMHDVSDVTVAGPLGPITLRVYRPDADADADGQGADTSGGLVFFHGGGWVIGSLDSHDRECRVLAARSGCVVVAVDYRMAPEHVFPAAVDDAWAALEHVAEHAADFGIDPARLAIGGDSAGGNLAAVMAIRARDAGLDLRLQMLIYPAVDLRLGYPSIEENAAGPFLMKVTMEWFGDHYLRGHSDDVRSHPDVSPALAESLAGVAPAVVVTAEHDPLRDEGNAYASALMEAGVTVQAKQWQGMAHAFFQLSPVLPHADRLLDELASELRLATAS